MFIYLVHIVKHCIYILKLALKSADSTTLSKQ